MEFKKLIHVVQKERGSTTYLDVVEGDLAEDAITTTETIQVATYELKEVKEGKLEPVFNTIIG